MDNTDLVLRVKLKSNIGLRNLFGHLKKKFRFSFNVLVNYNVNQFFCFPFVIFKCFVCTITFYLPHLMKSPFPIRHSQTKTTFIGAIILATLLNVI